MLEITPELLLQAYRIGVFPMGERRDDPKLYWLDPRLRAVLPLDAFHLPRRLARTVRSGHFEVSADRAFLDVVRACAEPRPGHPESWINEPIVRLYGELHRRGHAHSVEAWRDGRLVGGLYGVSVGAAFFGESMFSRRSDASKVALAWLVARLKVGNFSLLDCQFMTEHLASLGAISIPRETYVALLAAALGGGAAAGGASAALAAGDAAPPAGRADFLALDRLLELAGAAGADAPSGYVIAQLLGHTS